jgi:PAS domain S-box-containing protein
MRDNTTRTLIGWKEIAAYLNCSLSSARRREHEGLPIFRVGGSVRASADEIDAWIRKGRSSNTDNHDNDNAEPVAGEQPDLQEVISAFTVERDGRRFVVVPLGASGEERYRAARARTAEEKYREILEKVPVWIWETDARGRYKYSNNEVARILGRRPQEIVGRALSDFCVEPEDLARLEDAIEALRADGGYVKHLEYSVVNRGGELRRLRTYAEATVDADGDFVGIRGVSCDVTDLEPPRGKAKKNDEP